MIPETSKNITETLLNHIHALATTIGPRPPTQPGERQAAGYAYQKLEDLGYQPQMEHFKSATSIYHPTSSPHCSCWLHLSSIPFLAACQPPSQLV